MSPQSISVRSVTFAYDAAEDRILFAINQGAEDAAAAWLTRRLALVFYQRLTARLDRQASVLPVEVPTSARAEMASFRKEAALASTASRMLKTDKAGVQGGVAIGLVRTLELSQGRKNLTLTVIASDGMAKGELQVNELVRILEMLRREMIRAEWVGDRPSVKPEGEKTDDTGSVKRSVN